jgi:hypothetical protein
MNDRHAKAKQTGSEPQKMKLTWWAFAAALGGVGLAVGPRIGSLSGGSALNVSALCGVAIGTLAGPAIVATIVFFATKRQVLVTNIVFAVLCVVLGISGAVRGTAERGNSGGAATGR